MAMHISGYSANMMKSLKYKNISISSSELLACTTKELYTSLLTEKFGNYLVKDNFSSSVFNYHATYGPALRAPNTGTSNPTWLCHEGSQFVLEFPRIPREFHLTLTIANSYSYTWEFVFITYIKSDTTCIGDFIYLDGGTNAILSNTTSNQVKLNTPYNIDLYENELNTYFTSKNITNDNTILLYWFSPYIINSHARIPVYISNLEIII